jgi:hypothetical protein
VREFWCQAFSAARTWLVEVILSTGVLIVLYKEHQYKLLEDEATTRAIGLDVGLVWLGITLIFYAVFSFLEARRKVSGLGQWNDNRFVFHAPLTVATVLASPRDNERILRVTANDAPSLSVVRGWLENANNSMMLQATAQSPYFAFKRWYNLIQDRPWPSFADGPLHFAVRVGKRKEFFVEWIMPENAIPLELRVKISSFEIQTPGDADPQRYFQLHVSQPKNGFDFYAREP